VRGNDLLPMMAVTAWNTTVQAPPSLRVLKTAISVARRTCVSSLLAPVKTWNPIRKMLLRSSMIAVNSKAIRDHRPGCLIQLFHLLLLPRLSHSQTMSQRCRRCP
jgi:hypothetical protein